jgi:hypothetical protein
MGREIWYILLTRNTSPKLNQIQPDKMGGEATKYNSAFCVEGDAGEKGTFDSVLN